MSMAVNASANALSYLQQLLQYGSSGIGSVNSDPLLSLNQTAGAGDTSDASSLAAVFGSGGFAPPFDAGTLAALTSIQSQSAGVAGQASSDLFSQLDTDGDGEISKTEFENVLGTSGVDAQSADALFGKLDADGDSGVSQSELAKAQHGQGHHHGHHVGGGASMGGAQGGGEASSLLDSTDAAGATTQTTTNPDGSTTTTVSYANGTVTSTTTPAVPQTNNGNGASDGGSNTSDNGNLIQKLIQLQAQLLTQVTSTLSTFV